MARSNQDRFTELHNELEHLVASKYDQHSEFLGGVNTYVDQAKYNRWIIKTKKLIEDIYGKDSSYFEAFIQAESSGYMATNHTKLIKYIIPVFDAAKEDFLHSEINEAMVADTTALACVENICHKFPLVVRQLKQRHGDRQSIDINDEYDVQDLFHALLKIHFDDIRAEEYTPSYAGSSSRVDFLLKKEKLVIELKKTRRGLGAKELGNELTIDIARYRSHQDCETLVCFVYDPDGRVNNPVGVESDLENIPSNIRIKVIIVPK
ncbi:malate dehydrogenase [Yersinia ruckeri]|uniref:PD-(D/E)XK nuclease domain-containing protein n=1 Tax=Yersinia ruckeri TaxID=29486 RepID=UPI001F27BBA6|nr:malate dehydrogenase [Yersinia ruckeri]UIN02288.1 malate dehydrogenase [Yersinia ruckeri]